MQFGIVLAIPHFLKLLESAGGVADEYPVVQFGGEGVLNVGISTRVNDLHVHWQFLPILGRPNLKQELLNLLESFLVFLFPSLLGLSDLFFDSH